MNHPDDDPLAELETRLRAWRSAAMPPALLGRLLAAEPPPRPPRARRTRWRMAAGVVLGIVIGHYWPGDWPFASAPGHPDTARRASVGARFVETAWAPGERLTMNLATGLPADNVPGPWRLDGDPDAGTGLFPAVPIDGKLPLKVDCQF